MEESADNIEKTGNKKKVQGSKILTFSLLLTIPAVMTGCSTAMPVSDDCDGRYEYCEDDDYYTGTHIYSSGSHSKSSSIQSSSSGKNTYKGFGSSGRSGAGG